MEEFRKFQGVVPEGVVAVIFVKERELPLIRKAGQTIDTDRDQELFDEEFLICFLHDGDSTYYPAKDEGWRLYLLYAKHAQGKIEVRGGWLPREEDPDLKRERLRREALRDEIRNRW